MLVALTLVVVAAACGADTVTSGSSGSAPAGSDVPDPVDATDGSAEPPTYVLLRAPRWELTRALDPAGNEPLNQLEEPPVDWFAEYNRSTPGDPPPDSGLTGTVLQVESVRISGHQAGLDAFRAEYEALGFTFAPASVSGPLGAGAAMTAGGAESDPAVLVVESGPMAVMLLSYQLTSDDLVTLAADLEPVDDAGWLVAGGEIW